jgi:hypothetical protein
MYKYLPSSEDSVDPKNFQVKKPAIKMRTAIIPNMILFFIDMDNKINKKPCRSRQGIKNLY